MISGSFNVVDILPFFLGLLPFREVFAPTRLPAWFLGRRQRPDNIAAGGQFEVFVFGQCRATISQHPATAAPPLSQLPPVS